jgi:competence protein ComGC
MNEKGFTLIEMIIVLFVISILLLITIPNITSHNTVIKDKGCEALIKMVQAQVQVFEIEHDSIPTLEELKTGKYINTDKCPGGNTIVINAATGEVKESATP